MRVCTTVCCTMNVIKTAQEENRISSIQLFVIAFFHTGCVCERERQCVLTVSHSPLHRHQKLIHFSCHFVMPIFIITPRENTCAYRAESIIYKPKRLCYAFLMRLNITHASTRPPTHTHVSFWPKPYSY